MTPGGYYEPPKQPSSEPPPEWLKGEGEANDVVLSSRVRLARNLAVVPFASKSGPKERARAMEICRDQILTASLAARIVWEELHEATPLKRALLVERHLISKQLSKGRAGNDDPRGVAYSVPDERLSIMVNEEDHLRIQAIRSGLALAAAYREVDQADDLIEAGVDYAFNRRFGYLTACPTNVGTGVRMSVMLHLPALRLTGDIEKVKRAADGLCLAVRGYYGEGSEAVGDLYQISNQTTLGKKEGEILAQLDGDILPRVVEYERVARRELLTKRRALLEDQACRAWGLLTNARLLTTEESMQMLSMARLGALSDILPIDVKTINGLFLLVQPAHLQRAMNKEMDQEQRRQARATFVRAQLTRG